jgi:hypothetical protein
VRPRQGLACRLHAVRLPEHVLPCTFNTFVSTRKAICIFFHTPSSGWPTLLRVSLLHKEYVMTGSGQKVTRSKNFKTLSYCSTVSASGSLPPFAAGRRWWLCWAIAVLRVLRARRVEAAIICRLPLWDLHLVDIVACVVDELHVEVTRRDSGEQKACEKRKFFGFPSVCPESILAKRSFFIDMINEKTGRFSPYLGVPGRNASPRSAPQCFQSWSPYRQQSNQRRPSGGAA